MEVLTLQRASPFNPNLLLSRTVSNVICCLVFGERFGYEDKKFLHLLNTISENLDFLNSPLGQLYNIFPWLMERLPGPQHACFANADKLREFIKTKIQHHKETLDPSTPRDFIDCFLIRMNQEKDNAKTEFHHENLISTVLNLFFAGTETTSSTIRFALNVLIKYPDIQGKSPNGGFGHLYYESICNVFMLLSRSEKMQKEIDGVIGRSCIPSMDNRKSLPFTDAVIHEVQRFLDIVPFSLPHYALHDISFRGYTIPKDTMIIPMLHSVLKEEDRWATPQSFNPQHFLDENDNFKKNPSFLPFAAGKRACVGQSLARMELFILLVSLLQNFTFSCIEGPDSINLISVYSSFVNLPRTYQIIATPR